MKHSNILSKVVLTSAFSLAATSAIAGPGALINSPLFVEATAKPNIMVLTDTSGSMRHIVPEDALGADADKYDSTTTYIAACGAATVPDAREDAGTDSIYIRIIGGRPEISINSRTGSGDPLGTTAGTVCFDSTKTYNASLHADSGTSAAGGATAIYDGNYLNWYFDFDNTTTNWDASQRLKPGTDYRMNITKETLKTIIDGLDDSVRMGLARLYSSTGAQISETVKTLTAANKTALKSTIDTYSQSGVTPMAEALHQVGRYFLGDAGATDPGNLAFGSTSETNGRTTGTGANQLELHPGTASAAKYDRSAVFPTLASSGSVESPIQYWCQNNFVIFMSDGISRSDQNIPGILSDYDDDCAAGGCLSDDRKSSGSYIYDSGGSDYLDDVAQALFEIDLRPDIDDYDGNEVVNNIRTYTIAFADQDALNNKLLDDAAKQGGGQYFTSANAAELAKDFSAATNNILATTSSAAAVTFNTSTLGSDTAVYQALFTTARWSGELLSFPVEPTTGNIQFGCTLDVDANCWLASTHLDDLSYNSVAKTFTNNRQIITYDSTNRKAIPFKTPVDFTAPAANEITTAMINDMCAGPDAPLVSGVACTSATAGAKTDSQQFVDRMVSYIRGDRTYEDITTTPTFRTRQTVLGDIINATPAFIGTPKLPWPSIEDASNKFGTTGNRYSDYKTLKDTRTKVIYASANDGMLHAFRTETDLGVATPTNKGGDEIFAYMPSFVFSSNSKEGYHYLADPSYTHRYYLDLSPTFTDYFGVTKDSTNGPSYATATHDWHTILIGGSRGGAKKGIFALDVTDPLTITESTGADAVLWEFTNSDDVNLGHTYSKPTVVMTYAVDGSGFNRWAAIFGNGYQNDSAAVATGSTCTAQLFIVFLDGGLDGTWTLGTDPDTADYMRIDTEVGTTAAGDCNGLSTPALADVDGDQILDRVYAGDVKGNMWAFDLTCGGAGCGGTDFKVAYKSGSTPAPLFTAMDDQATPEAQPIMAKPILARVPETPNAASKSPNLMVLFGTGQYHNPTDNIGTNKINTFYGIWDSGTGKLTDDRSNTASANLVEQVLTTTTTAYGQIRNITSNTIDWTKKYGWYINMDPKNAATFEAEERSVVTPAVRSNVLFFNTLLPNAQICGFGGSGWLMSVDVATGGAPSSTVFDVNSDGVVDSADDIGGQVAVGEKFDGIPADSSFIGDNQYTQSSDKSIKKRKIKLEGGLKEGRLSWRELRPDN